MKKKKNFYDLLKNEIFPYDVDCLGKEFIVREETYSPKYMVNTYIFAKNVPVEAGMDVLEIGTGIGVIAIFAAFYGANQVVATDINHAAVANTKENIKRHQVEQFVEVRCGDMFEPLEKTEKFDLIFTCLPYSFADKNMELSMLERGSFDPEYNSYRRFIVEGSRYLKPNGRIMFGFSRELGQLNAIERIANEAGYEIQEIHQELCESDIENYTWTESIFELRKKS